VSKNIFAWSFAVNVVGLSSQRHRLAADSNHMHPLSPISWHWVKGHASARKRPDELTFPEILNETADELATHARRSKNLTQTDDDDHWPEQTVSIIGPRGRMCGHLAKELRYCCTAPDLLSYWKDRFH
jgi:hypothetical protein